jgi:aryl carrier-like protein
MQCFREKLIIYSDVPSEAEAKRIADEGLKTCGLDGTNWMNECEKLREYGVNVQMLQGEVQFFKIIKAVFAVYRMRYFAKYRWKSGRKPVILWFF